MTFLPSEAEMRQDVERGGCHVEEELAPDEGQPITPEGGDAPVPEGKLYIMESEGVICTPLQ